MNREDIDTTTGCSSVTADESAARVRLERFSRFLVMGAVRAAEGRTPNHQNAGKPRTLSNTDQSVDDPINISDASGG